MLERTGYLNISKYILPLFSVSGPELNMLAPELSQSMFPLIYNLKNVVS